MTWGTEDSSVSTTSNNAANSGDLFLDNDTSFLHQSSDVTASSAQDKSSASDLKRLSKKKKKGLTRGAVTFETSNSVMDSIMNSSNPSSISKLGTEGGSMSDVERGLFEEDTVKSLRDELKSQRKIIEEQKEIIDYFQETQIPGATQPAAPTRALASSTSSNTVAANVSTGVTHQYVSNADDVLGAPPHHHYVKRQSLFYRGRRSSDFYEAGVTKDETEAKEAQLPQDTYSFLVCSKPCSVSFIFAAFVFSFQMLIFSFLATDQINVNADNPLSLPANIETTVRVTQFITIVIAVLTQEDLREALELFSEGYSDERLKPVFPDASFRKYWFSCILRFFEGALGLTVTFFVIVAESSVIELLLNFSALEFVSQLDNVAFFLASVGYFGRTIRLKTVKIAETSFPVPSVPKTERQLHSLMLLIIMGSMMGAWSVVVYQQTSGKYLCKEIFVQFGDEASSELGAFTGLYTRINKKGRNNDRVEYIKTGWTNGTFSYCNELESWVFARGDATEPCDSWLAKSAETKSFDILDTESSWTAKYEGSEHGIQVEHLRMTCVDDDTHGDTCKTDLCSSCPKGSYGINCTFNSDNSPCKFLDMDEESRGFSLPDGSFLTDFKILEYEEVEENENSIKSTKSYQFYYSPVYIPTDPNGNALIFFAGRRWYLASDFNLRNLTLKEYIFHLYEREKLPLVDEITNSISFVSETVDIVSVQEATTPLGLRWFSSITVENKDRLPLPDPSRPSNAFFTCGFCNNVTNPCLHGGICESDGECTCKHDAEGHLCKNTPVGNGVCNEFFNKDEFNFDGGDCCGATCLNLLTRSSCGGGSRGTFTEAFGNVLASGGRGYSSCTDPSMSDITIEIDPGFDSVDVEVSLVCDGLTYLQLPKGVLHVENHEDFRGTEVVRLKDGSDCELEVTLHDERIAVGTIEFDATFKVFLSEDEESVLVEETKTIQLDGDSSDFKTSFFVSSLLEDLKVVTSLDLLKNSSTPQGEAIRYLSADTHEHASRGSEFLVQRYAFFVMNIATGNPLGISKETTIINTLSECALNSFLKCTGDYITEIDISRSDYQGIIPPEVALFSHLRSVDLSYNKLAGNLPSELGKLKSLSNLKFDNNNFSGPIPPEYGNMENLINIDISENNLVGTIPTEIYRLTNLEIIRLSGNSNITGSISTDVSNLGKLKNFVIENADLTGSIPSSIGVLTNLIEIDIEGNQLIGPIPSELGALTKLTELDLEDNKLTGSIPSELNRLNLLNVVVLKYNTDLTGTVPGKMCSFANLHLFLDGTSIACPKNCGKQCNNCADECDCADTDECNRRRNSSIHFYEST